MNKGFVNVINFVPSIEPRRGMLPERLIVCVTGTLEWSYRGEEMTTSITHRFVLQARRDTSDYVLAIDYIKENLSEIQDNLTECILEQTKEKKHILDGFNTEEGLKTRLLNLIPDKWVSSQDVVDSF